MGHITKICWWLPNKTTQTDIPQALAALTLDTTIANTEWTSNTGASNHMIGKTDMLTNPRKYKGINTVLIGNGSSLQISGIDDTTIKQKNTTLPLQNVLYVLDLTKNTLSVSQLTTQFPINCEFFDVNFHVKDPAIGQNLITGTRRGDLYVLSNLPELHFSNMHKSGMTEV